MVKQEREHSFISAKHVCQAGRKKNNETYNKRKKTSIYPPITLHVNLGHPNVHMNIYATVRNGRNRLP